jgi:ABC-type glycerol-3-phosphate transport system substrate-binding protein
MQQTMLIIRFQFEFARRAILPKPAGTVCILRSALVAIGLAVVCGCGGTGNEPAAKKVAEQVPKAPAQLRLAVVDDSAMAKSIARLQGEWKAQTGITLEIVEHSTEEISSARKIDADAVIYPSAMMGALAERDLIRPISPAWLSGDPLEAADLLQSPDALEFTWDGKAYGVPLGSPLFVLLYRSDLFAQYRQKPPRTWEDYQKLTEFFQSAAQLRKRPYEKTPGNEKLILAEPWSATAEPLAAGWAGRVLLARAAAYARHRDYFSVLFDRETMEPLIAGPAFVRALTELVAAAKNGPKDLEKETPADAVRMLLGGYVALAIAWPSAAIELSKSTDAAADKVQVSVAKLPGSSEAYNPRHSAWEARRNDEEVSIPLHGISGRVGSVVRGTDSGEAAFKLLTWLASKRWSSEVSPASTATTMFRQSQLDDSQPWIGAEFSTEAGRNYGEVLSGLLRQCESVMALRIPGEAEYMAALDEAVQAAVAGKQTPQQALDQAAAKWKEITARRGVEQLREEYRRSLKAAQ